jgi:TM2 domain-containing membrane protein YozV
MNVGEVIMANDHSQRGIATLLSILIGGFGGQFYNGQVMKGMVILGLQAINYVMFFFLIGFVTMPLVWAYGVWDAYRYAGKLERRL